MLEKEKGFIKTKYISISPADTLSRCRFTKISVYLAGRRSPSPLMEQSGHRLQWLWKTDWRGNKTPPRYSTGMFRLQEKTKF
ncbi:hypothetical protein CEXT_536291 [Caerostris extrusa]|uniref:Uncharacterized protein n=1 Tax=Caerostris extrusa TaxID=172846 RepID=A0AAV4PMQ5_CAEEX|nr:hypothetical protein CEXT_536291 [Caerostris extrusa]